MLMDSVAHQTGVAVTGSGAARVLAIATVAENRSLCREHFELVIRTDAPFPTTDAGQFIQLGCANRFDAESPSLEGSREETEWIEGQFPQMNGLEIGAPVAFLRRPFSLAGRKDLADGTAELRVIHRVVGRGTRWLSDLKAGERVDLIGPIGNRFTVPADGRPAILVGGGVGIPPMLYLADLLKRSVAVPTAVAICGATTRSLFPLTIVEASNGANEPKIREFAKLGMDSIITTDDGSIGLKGFVTHALDRLLESMDLSNEANRPTIYTCGPEIMMQRVAGIALKRNLPVQIAVERAMACGLGTCQSCCIRVRSPGSADGWRYALACTNGPVFCGSDLLW